MSQARSGNLYELISGQPFTRNGIRPGGLDLTRHAIARAQLAPGSEVLDIGCGTGVTVEHLIREHEIKAIGIDASSVLVDRGRVRDKMLPLVLGSAEELPFANEAFDAVLSECAVSLVQHRYGLLEECFRVLKSPGTIILTDIYARNPAQLAKLRELPVQSCLRGALDKNQLFDECSAAGFDAVSFEDHSYLLKDFAVQIIWAHGSLDRFWAEAGGCCVSPPETRRAIHEARPGYFLLIGRKTERL
jgi:arsenite methyltransferase